MHIRVDSKVKAVVKTGDGFLDYDWFRGAEFNIAENLLRIRDDRLALIYLDETGYEETVTYAEVFEETKLYAAAFRKHGLQKGDTVACHMSNRKEAIYAMLATTSIGAIWGGPHPFCGARFASNTVARMEPKFLITIDCHQDDGVVWNILENLPIIVDKVFLEEFLESGRNPDDSVPDIVFEQLPFSHPAFLNFTSGTTGLPKGLVHSAGMLIPEFENIAFDYNLKSGDVVFNWCPVNVLSQYLPAHFEEQSVGWTAWDFFTPCLALGITIFLYCGSHYWIRDGNNMWDLIAKYKAKYCFLVPSMLDKLEKLQIVPSPNSNLENLKVVFIDGSPVKVQNFTFVQNKIGKHIFVAILYGATESFGFFSGVDMNLPLYAGEVQVPALGMDIRVVDEKGRSLIGEKGEIIFAAPCPSFPIYFWKDVDHTIMKETYLSKYPGVWCQHDEGLINPDTKGLIVLGRSSLLHFSSDDTLIQYGDRFAAGDVYFAIHGMEEIMDYICVNQSRNDGECRVVLFVKLKPGFTFTPELREKIALTIDRELWEDCVPQVILEVPDIPYNVNNKRLEGVVRKIVATNQIPQVNNITNPECLKYFCDIPELLSYNV
ncbi:acetoacetyl-CoA synthetase-like [Stegodyphus dumicola]|uniref:acetoacetyl-CoA synthetase-like n=1 Tax=Stegodyphus dumicola TaxID=202533 RepID=UPI0015B08196|nr:acetoacetyl-CoA synthetase-like [Stegodyphus dumicola]